MQKPFGVLLVVNLNTDLKDILTSGGLLHNFCINISKPLGLKVLQIHEEMFPPHDGMSVSAIISESSITVHTWPEICFARILVDSCKDIDTDLAVKLVESWFQPTDIDVDIYDW